MDTKNIHVLEARMFKEKGNDYFKAGRLEDARNCYFQILDCLAGETTLIRVETEEENELVHAAHLNLAACELKLGNSANVIKHSDMALQLNSYSVKAYFRRAKAYQVVEKYDLAFKDFLQVNKLNPHISIENDLETCEEMLFAKLTVQERSKMEDKDEKSSFHEMEISSGHEGNLNDNWVNCAKNPGHTDFIPVKDFNIAHLPADYHDRELVDFFKLQALQTVHLKVRGNSPQRPNTLPGTSEPYPFFGSKFRKTIRYGSGWVCNVDVFTEQDNKECPCKACKKPGTKAKRQWGQVKIYTAAHVVFDFLEGKKTICYFSYDSDDVELESCPSLKDPVDLMSNTERDLSHLTFATHNLKLAKRLGEIDLLLIWLWKKLKSRYVTNFIDDSDEDYVERMSELSSQWHLSLTRLHKQKDDFAAILIENDEQKLLELVSNPDADGDFVFQMFVMYLKNGVFQDGETGKDLLDAYTRLYDAQKESLKKFDGFIEKEKTHMADKAYRDFISSYYTKCKEQATAIEGILQYTKSRQKSGNKTESGHSSESTNKLAYDARHPLTVIISHPHGCSKKITVGHVDKRTGDEYHSRYSYTAPTCPGSSGARVFILGRWSLRDYPHSKRGIEEEMEEHLNVSSTFSDFM